MTEDVRKKVCIAVSQGNFETSIATLKPLAENGDAEAQYALGNLYFEGDGVSKEEAVYWLKKASQQKFPEAFVKLSCFSGVADHERISLLQTAAQLGSSSAQCALGTIYATGDSSVAIDLGRAAEWYRAAATAGDVEAQYELGFMMFLGEGTRKDIPAAVAMLEMAANNGHPEATKLLAEITKDFSRELDPNHTKIIRGRGDERGNK